MKKHIFIFILIILYADVLFPQADLTIHLFLHNADYSGNETVYFGIDSTATDGIDPWLGESDLPPDFCAPWGTNFCTFFRLPPFGGTILSYSDFRFGELPYTGQVTHNIEVINYESTGNDSIYIRYDLPEGVILHFYDELGGIVINFTVEDSGEAAYLYISALRNLWIDVNYNNVIPVDISSFTGDIMYGNKVELKWRTATETNNSGFEIQKQVCSKQSAVSSWKPIGFVPGFGTTTEPKSYSFVDNNVTTGIYKYRLKQIDFDGTFTYLPTGQAGSNEIKVQVDFTPKEFMLYQNYPNPFNPTTTIKYTIPSVAPGFSLSKVTLKVYDLLGNEVAVLVNENKQPGVYEVEFNAGSLASGTYLYKLRTGSNIGTGKMLLLK